MQLHIQPYYRPSQYSTSGPRLLGTQAEGQHVHYVQGHLHNSVVVSLEYLLDARYAVRHSPY